MVGNVVVWGWLGMWLCGGGWECGCVGVVGNVVVWGWMCLCEFVGFFKNIF